MFVIAYDKRIKTSHCALFALGRYLPSFGDEVIVFCVVNFFAKFIFLTELRFIANVMILQSYNANINNIKFYFLPFLLKFVKNKKYFWKQKSHQNLAAFYC